MNNEIIDIESAKEIFLGNCQLYLKFLYRFPNESPFSDLEKAYKDKDIKKAFECAHTLKGVVSNLSLKLLKNTLTDIVEPLRVGNLPTEESWNKFSAAHDVTIKYIAKLRDGCVSPLY